MNSTEKPVWPHSSICTLTPHPSGSWCKKIKGTLKYFGPISNPDKALRNYLDFVNSSLHGRQVAPRADGATVTVSQALNRCLNEKRHLVTSGELSAGQFARYRAITRHVNLLLGDRPLASLQPPDFADLRRSLTGGAITLKNKITWIRTLMNWADDYFKIRVSYGGMFDKPSYRNMEATKRQRQLFTAREIRALLKASSATTRCFILLGINCGFGQSDVSSLTNAAIRLKEGVIEHPRGKTRIPRVCPLWPETIKALKGYKRPNGEMPELFFITKFGVPFVREPAKYDAAGLVKSTTYTDAVGQELDKVCDGAGVPRRGFYTFRHTFRSVADEVADTTAIECIMGHLKRGMGGVYVQLRENRMERLRAVTDRVHEWLFRSGNANVARKNGRGVKGRAGRGLRRRGKKLAK